MDGEQWAAGRLPQPADDHDDRGDQRREDEPLEAQPHAQGLVLGRVADGREEERGAEEDDERPEHAVAVHGRARTIVGGRLYDPPAVNFDLSDEQREIQRLVRDFADQEVRPVAEELDREKRFPYDIVEQLGELELMGIPYPEEYGGGGADTLSYALAIEELARVDSSVAITVAAHTSLGTWPIYAFGSDEQKAEWLPELCRGQKLGAFGLTEPEAGSDAQATATTARLEDGEWVINGAKQFITNAGTDISGHVTITSRTGDGEISNIIVPNGTPGYSIEAPYRKMGWNASDTRPLAFADARVPEENLLGPRGAGFRQFLQALDGGRISVSAMGVGLAQGALDEALSYAKERRAFGQPIAKHQAIQMKIADLSAEIEAARLLTYKSALLKDAGKSFNLTAAQAKLKTGRLAVRATEEAVQIHGGYGYIEEYPVCRFYRDAKILTIGEGTDEVQQMVIARQLGC
jgi:short-chain 2-methylacyl-CoA dehydrogenase